MEALPELEGQNFDTLLDNVYNTGEIFVGVEVPITLAHDEGLAPEERYFNFSYQPIYNIHKIIDGVLVFGYEVTEEVRGRKIQKESDALFRVLTDAMPQKMWTADANGKVNYFNQQWFNYTDKSFEELKDLGWTKIVHPDDWAQNQQTWKYAISTGEDFQQEHRFLNNNGIYHWHLTKFVAQKNADNKIIMWVGTSTDINEQKLESEKIRLAEEFNRNVLQSSPDCVKVLDNEGRIIFMNTNGLCLLDIDDCDSIINRNWRELWGNENKEAIDAAITKGLKGETAQFQASAPTFKSIFKWWDVKVSPLVSTNGVVTQLIAVSRDITEQKNYENTIAESEKRFRQMANAMPQKVWTTDDNGKVNYLNHQWMEYTHKSFEELKDSGWKKVIHPDDWDLNQKTWQSSINSGEDFQLQHRFRRYDGKYYWHLSQCLVQKNEQGKIVGWIGTHTDIDEQKIMEKAKDEFMSIASHELKTPLTTAKAYIQLLEMSMKQTNDKDVVFAEKAGLSINRLNDLIGELMDVSKIQNGKLNLNITTFNFNEMAADAIEAVQYASPGHHLLFSGKIKEPVEGDKERLTQVIVNLLSNAVKYSPDAKEVFINIEEQVGLVKVSVKDTGIGIRKQSLEKIFERYYREEQRAVHFQGLGIGLFICYEIIQRHNGKIWAESEPGEGSTFYFTIPVSQ